MSKDLQEKFEKEIKDLNSKIDNMKGEFEEFKARLYNTEYFVNKYEIEEDRKEKIRRTLYRIFTSDAFFVMYKALAYAFAGILVILILNALGLKEDIATLIHALK